jgi:hypothetical protein
LKLKRQNDSFCIILFTSSIGVFHNQNYLINVIIFSEKKQFANSKMSSKTFVLLCFFLALLVLATMSKGQEVSDRVKNQQINLKELMLADKTVQEKLAVSMSRQEALHYIKLIHQYFAVRGRARFGRAINAIYGLTKE